MTLPGMPIRVGDPGVFVCGPQDVAPWESVRPVRKAARAGAGVEQVRAPRPPAVWLVLAMCPDCVYMTGRYCRDHNSSNWWLTTMASAPRNGNAPGSTA